jgi:hypothetical protein
VCDCIDKLGDLGAVMSLDLAGTVLRVEASPPEITGSD